MAKISYRSGRCSNCGSGNLYYGAIALDYESVYHPFVCKDCGKEGKEWYDLEYTKTIMDKE